MRILVLPFVAGIAAVADSANVLKSELAFWLFLLYLDSLSIGVVRKAHFLHHLS